MQAAAAGEPFHVVHFDGHGAMPSRSAGGGGVQGGRPAMMSGAGEGVLAFEKPGGGSDHVAASKVAAVLAEGRVPVAVLNACQSGAVGKELEASVATALLRAGCAAVVAMAYSDARANRLEKATRRVHILLAWRRQGPDYHGKDQ